MKDAKHAIFLKHVKQAILWSMLSPWAQQIHRAQKARKALQIRKARERAKYMSTPST